MPDQFFALPAEVAFEVAVDVDEAPVTYASDGNHQRTGVKCLGEALFGLEQRCRGLILLGDVLDHAEDDPIFLVDAGHGMNIPQLARIHGPDPELHVIWLTVFDQILHCRVEQGAIFGQRHLFDDGIVELGVAHAVQLGGAIRNDHGIGIEMVFPVA